MKATHASFKGHYIIAKALTEVAAVPSTLVDITAAQELFVKTYELAGTCAQKLPTDCTFV